MFRFLILSALFAFSTAAYNKLELTNCGGDGIRINEIDIQPMPIRFPGSLKVLIDADLTKAVNGPIKVDVDMRQGWWFGWVPAPCMTISGVKVGSCTYDDICVLMEPLREKGCPAEMQQLDIGCTCPFKPSHVRFEMADIVLPYIPAGLGYFASGDYKVTAKMYEGGALVSCFEAKVSLGA